MLESLEIQIITLIHLANETRMWLNFRLLKIHSVQRFGMLMFPNDNRNVPLMSGALNAVGWEHSIGHTPWNLCITEWYTRNSAGIQNVFRISRSIKRQHVSTKHSPTLLHCSEYKHYPFLDHTSTDTCLRSSCSWYCRWHFQFTLSTQWNAAKTGTACQIQRPGSTECL
jgi:hypothetical protein